eukprot:4245037-Alexandrium_andersonii.AAC.1
MRVLHIKSNPLMAASIDDMLNDGVPPWMVTEDAATSSDESEGAKVRVTKSKQRAKKRLKSMSMKS